LDKWTASLSLIALTIVVHATGVALIGLGLRAIRRWVEERRIAFVTAFMSLIGLISVIGLMLAVLHGIEAGIWALAYWWLGCFDSVASATLYSLEAITTRSAHGLTLEGPWQAMGALESADGVLLFGISTGFIVVVMQQFWPILVARDAYER
jgi:hypothetical protein